MIFSEFQQKISQAKQIVDVITSKTGKDIVTISGSLAVAIYISLLGFTIENIMVNDIDVIIKDKKRFHDDIRQIWLEDEQFLRVQSSQSNTCTYTCGEKSFDLICAINIKYIEICIFGTTLHLENVFELRNKYIENFRDNTNDQKKINVLNNLCEMLENVPNNSNSYIATSQDDTMVTIHDKIFNGQENRENEKYNELYGSLSRNLFI